MAKRRRKKPNISQTVLDQARQGVIDEGGAAAPAADSSASAPAAPTAAAPKLPPRRRRALQAAQLERRKDEGALEAEYIADLLANPTKVVTEDDLRADYGFVIKDLRNMGILAAGLFIALIIVSLVLL
ncbi:MAG: hypothetical protein OXI77_04805 [Chloroflexota bacterium]|nr:hypothetical protein [Chloroflexota bacterium]MDE2907735.1 hypothetical protein [Chloroflexota bacterium]